MALTEDVRICFLDSHVLEELGFLISLDEIRSNFNDVLNSLCVVFSCGGGGVYERWEMSL